MLASGSEGRDTLYISASHIQQAVPFGCPERFPRPIMSLSLAFATDDSMTADLGVGNDSICDMGRRCWTVVRANWKADAG